MWMALGISKDGLGKTAFFFFCRSFFLFFQAFFRPTYAYIVSYFIGKSKRKPQETPVFFGPKPVIHTIHNRPFPRLWIFFSGKNHGFCQVIPNFPQSYPAPCWKKKCFQKACGMLKICGKKFHPLHFIRRTNKNLENKQRAPWAGMAGRSGAMDMDLGESPRWSPPWFGAWG